MMNGFERFRKHWLWALVAFFVTTVIALASAYFQYRSTKHDLGGSLNATFHSRLLNNREARTIVVCMEDTTIDLTNLYVTPTFDNPAEYSLKDFSLSFDAECTNVQIIPSSFVDAHEYEKNEWIYKYKDNVLAAHDDTKKPFSHFVLTDTKGRCYIKTKASYDGASDAFRYNTDVWFIVEPNKKHLSFDDWKINCKKRIFEVIEDKFYDVYYYTHNNKPEYQFDVALGSTDNKTSNQSAHNESKNQNNYQESTAKPVESPKPLIQNDNSEKEVIEEKTEEQKPQEGNTTTEPKDINIKEYYVKEYSSYTSLIINLDNSFTPGAEYILLYTNRDSLNNEYTSYHYVSGYSKSIEKQCTINFLNSIDISKMRNLRFLQNCDVDDLVKIDSTSGYEFRNISEYEIICVVRYSDNTTSYRTLRGGEKMQLKDIGNLPFLVFNTGVKNEVISQNSDPFRVLSCEEGSLGYYLRILLVAVLFITWAFGLFLWGFLLISFFANWADYFYVTAKKEFVNDLNSMKIGNILKSSDGFWLKIIYLYLSISLYVFPITTILLLYIIYNT